jgi:FkbM family methyltransferase
MSFSGFFIRNLNKLTKPLGLIVKFDSLATNEGKLIARLLEIHKIKMMIDVGANVGQSSAKILGLGFKGDILSFEPIQGAFRILESKSKNFSNWQAFQLAIGDREEQIEINVSENIESSSVLNILDEHTDSAPDSRVIGKNPCQMVRLDYFFEKNNFPQNDIFLKIDVQGLEPQVLSGAKNTLKKVKIIQLELSIVQLYEGSTTYKDLISKIEELGFILHSLIPGFINPGDGQLLQMDGIFIRKNLS